VAWGAKNIKFKQSTTLKKERSRTTTFGLDLNRALEAIEFNIEKLEGCTKIGIVTFSLEESQMSMHASW
jgi:hypothetical protein